MTDIREQADEAVLDDDTAALLIAGLAKHLYEMESEDMEADGPDIMDLIAAAARAMSKVDTEYVEVRTTPHNLPYGHRVYVSLTSEV